MELFKEIQQAKRQLSKIALPAPLIEDLNLSKHYGASISLKREDLQVDHAIKIRGPYNKISTLTPAEKEAGIVCSSDGNHAQAVAYCCFLLKVKGKIYMPKNTPKLKVEQIQLLGKNYVEIMEAGNSFEQANAIALGDASINRKVFIHPFNDLKVIAGQGTVGLEILDQHKKSIDYLFVPLEGGGLTAGLSAVFEQLSPNTKIIGVTIQDNPSLEILDYNSDDSKHNSNLTFELCEKNLSEIIKIPEGKACSAVLHFFSNQDIKIDPAGVLGIAALDYYADKIKDKNIVCIISGGFKNTEKETQIVERSLVFEGLVHYLMIEFPKCPGVLKEFINDVLGPDDELTYFQPVQKDNSHTDSVLVRLSLKNSKNICAIKANMQAKNLEYQSLNDKYDLFLPI